MPWRAVVLAAALALAACNTTPDAYPPPEQRPPLEDYHPARQIRPVAMGGGDARSYIVRDIWENAGNAWRWTKKRPAIRMMSDTNANLRYVIDFTIPGVTFHETGPVTLTFYVNGHQLDRVRYAEGGSKHFEKPIPPEWIVPEQWTEIAAEIDKVYVKDGDTYGFILSTLGLARE